jgi:hypothetical protein
MALVGMFITVPMVVTIAGMTIGGIKWVRDWVRLG